MFRNCSSFDWLEGILLIFRKSMNVCLQQKSRSLTQIFVSVFCHCKSMSIFYKMGFSIPITGIFIKLSVIQSFRGFKFFKFSNILYLPFLVDSQSFELCNISKTEFIRIFGVQRSTKSGKFRGNACLFLFFRFLSDRKKCIFLLSYPCQCSHI